MYIRMSSLSVVRAGRNFSKLSTFVAIMLVSLTFLLFIALISPDESKVTPSNGLFYRQEDNQTRSGTTPKTSAFSITDFFKKWKTKTNNFKKKKSKEINNKRMSELSTWTMNQSVFVEDYLNLSDINSFILQPTSTNSAEEISPFCGPNVKILAMVASASANFKARSVIRETWGSKTEIQKKGIKLIFVLGHSQNTTIEELVAEESAKYDDILEEDFIDTYHNLTLKSIAMLKWVNLTCTKNNVTNFPRHVLKTDDDMFINFDRLLIIAQSLPNAKMIGRLTCGAMPIGDVHSKLYMPKYLYPHRLYPGYLSGTAYLISDPEIIPILLANTLTITMIHLEDIYITGLLARPSRIYPDDSPFFTYNRLEPKDDCAFRFMVDSHQMKPEEMMQISKNLKSPPPVPCNLKKAKWLRKVVRLNKRLRKLCLFDT